MRSQDLLIFRQHRPWPYPETPWIMTQTWYNLLFAHWPIPAHMLRPFIPACFELETFEGQAWLGVVPFGMADVRLRNVPKAPLTHRFLELNVRTYVRMEDKPGVYFFSLDAANEIAVWTARLWFNLPYFDATMHMETAGSQISYHSRRIHRKAPAAQFAGTYAPVGNIFQSQPGSFDYWLTERYCLYTTDRKQRPYRGEIHHLPWPLQRAEADIRQNTMALASQIDLPPIAPILHFAAYLNVLIWPLVPVNPNMHPTST